MSIPITGVLLLPLGLIIAFMPWRYCLIGLVIFAMMSPGAVVNYGSFGLQPGYYLALLLIARSAFEITTQKFTLNSFVSSRLRPLWWFTVTVFAVLFIALCFFQGDVETLPGTSPSEIIAALFELELAGLVRQLPGKSFIKVWAD